MHVCVVIAAIFFVVFVPVVLGGGEAHLNDNLSGFRRLGCGYLDVS